MKSNVPKHLDIHCIVDNYATHKKEKVNDGSTSSNDGLAKLPLNAFVAAFLKVFPI